LETNLKQHGGVLPCARRFTLTNPKSNDPSADLNQHENEKLNRNILQPWVCSPPAPWLKSRWTTVVTNGLAEPCGVTVDSDANIYIADSVNNRHCQSGRQFRAC